MISTIVESFVSSSKFLARARKNKEWDGSATLASGVYLRKLDNKTFLVILVLRILRLTLHIINIDINIC